MKHIEEISIKIEYLLFIIVFTKKSLIFCWKRKFLIIKNKLLAKKKKEKKIIRISTRQHHIRRIIPIKFLMKYVSYIILVISKH